MKSLCECYVKSILIVEFRMEKKSEGKGYN